MILFLQAGTASHFLAGFWGLLEGSLLGIVLAVVLIGVYSYMSRSLFPVSAQQSAAELQRARCTRDQAQQRVLLLQRQLSQNPDVAATSPPAAEEPDPPPVVKKKKRVLRPPLRLG